MKTMLLAAAAALSLGVGSAYADSGDGPAANTFFTELPGVVAQAQVPNAPVYAQNPQAQTQQAQNGRAVPRLRHPVEPRHLAVRPQREPGCQQLTWRTECEAERPAPLPAFFVWVGGGAARISSLSSNSSPGEPGASFCRQAECPARRRRRGRRKIAWAVTQVTSPAALPRHHRPTKMERTDARLPHCCRDGVRSGRCMGGPGAVRRLSLVDAKSLPWARVHVVKGHVAQPAPGQR